MYDKDNCSYTKCRTTNNNINACMCSLTMPLKVKLKDFSLITFDERITFDFNASGHCLVRVSMLHYLRIGLHFTITHAMQQTLTHKEVTGRFEAKKLLSRRRQAEYSTCRPISKCVEHAVSKTANNLII